MGTYVTIERTFRQVVLIESDVTLEQIQWTHPDLIRSGGKVVGEAVVKELVTKTSKEKI